MVTVDLVGLVLGFGFVVVAGAFALPIWALRRHKRMFPKGWDRTGRTTVPGRARRFETMWAYFPGGRGNRRPPAQ